MTTTEFSNEFDILYNSIATNAAPNIDIYEKSQYLTKAQLELVKNYFTPKGNKYQEGFEFTSKRRNDFKQLIKQHEEEFNLQSNFLPKLTDNSFFYNIPKDVLFIIYEQVILGLNISRLPPITSQQELIELQNKIDKFKCIDNLRVNVKPKAHDEINTQIDNPFKKPSKNVVWRVDYSNINPFNQNVELISEYPIKKYILRYIKFPNPIILRNLNEEFPGEGLSINGFTAESTSELNPSMHPEILDRAVELAMADYKPEMLGIKAQMSSRNE